MKALLKKWGQFLWREKVWWLTPLFLILLLMILLITLTENPVAPFIYTLF